MPNIKSAAKRMRQNAKRQAANRASRSALRTAIKKTRRAAEEANVEQAVSQLAQTLGVIGKTAQKGLIHKNKAARDASRLTKKVNALQAKSAS
ncbi:MAG: 30S ribosomal protein S20 [bacterium]|nr:30S ribosomal protein S20 [bacterium]